MRRLAFSTLLLALAGCSPAAPEQPQAEPGAERIACALGEGSQFGPDCLVERITANGQEQLIVRHPDGGFRRFLQTADGRGLVELDGADPVKRTLAGDMLEISVGHDRYRFRARVHGGTDASAR